MKDASKSDQLFIMNQKEHGNKISVCVCARVVRGVSLCSVACG